MSDNRRRSFFHTMTRIRIHVLVAGGLLLTALAVARAGDAPVTWRCIGPGAGGSMFGMAIHPSNRKIMILGGIFCAALILQSGGGQAEGFGEFVMLTHARRMLSSRERPFGPSISAWAREWA
ncbi:MAG: hypothetical protein KAI66_08185 [Lentisphaeria bacterium]|nr:hypothetical protein [Lentisphaeria bacterium]